MLGIEDHGIMTFSLMMEWGGSGQGFGGYALDGRGGEIGHAKSILAIRKILETIGVDSWEKVKGQLVRIKKDSEYNGSIKAIGHIINDQWFEIDSFFKE